MSTLHIVVSEAGPIIPSDYSRHTGDDSWLVRMVDDEKLDEVGRDILLPLPSPSSSSPQVL
jgi:hypothetical protein